MAAKQQTKNKNKLVKTGLKSNIRPGVSTSSLLEYFRAGESYTSLVLGILVVIIASVLLLSFFKTRPDSQKGTTSISTVAQNVTVTPTPTLMQISGTEVNKVAKIISTPTIEPTRVVMPTALLSPTPIKAAEKPTEVKLPMDAKTYTIMSGDDLWAIAVKVYGDGYKWVDIAKANDLTDPGLIHVGNTLKLPPQDVTSLTVSQTLSEVKTTESPKMQTSTQNTQKITGNTYTIVKGDVLWDIAVRAYGDGYKWVDIAKVNNLIDPNLIFSGNTLKILR